MATSEEKTVASETAKTHTATSDQGVKVSIFGIIVVGLLAGLIVGLITSPNFTLQGFFLGFAGGSLTTVAIYFFSTPKSRTFR